MFSVDLLRNLQSQELALHPSECRIIFNISSVYSMPVMVTDLWGSPNVRVFSFCVSGLPYYHSWDELQLVSHCRSQNATPFPLNCVNLWSLVCCFLGVWVKVCIYKGNCSDSQWKQVEVLCLFCLTPFSPVLCLNGELSLCTLLCLQANSHLMLLLLLFFKLDRVLFVVLT